MTDLNLDILEAIDDLLKRKKVNRVDEVFMELLLATQDIDAVCENGLLVIHDRKISQGIDIVDFLTEYVKEFKHGLKVE